LVSSFSGAAWRESGSAFLRLKSRSAPRPAHSRANRSTKNQSRASARPRAFANALREQLGETLASRRQFNQPLEQATIASLPALEAYLARQTKRAEHEKKKRFAVVEQR
jgi:hypothetical protein